MELPSKLLKQIAFNTRPKIEEHTLVVMDESIHEEHLSQPLQTNNKQFKIAVTFLTGYNGVFNVTDKHNKFYFKKAIKVEDFIQITIPPGAYETESLNNEIKKIIVEKGYYDENTHPFKIRANFTTLGSIVEIITPGPMISFVYDDSIVNLLGFNEILVWGKYNLSDNPVDILPFDNIFIECDIAQGMIYRGRRSGIIHNFTMDVDPGYNYIETFQGGISWCMLQSRDNISSICFKLKNEINEIVSFNGQSITFRLSIKVI